MFCLIVFFFKQKTAYEMRISDWSSDVCSSDLGVERKIEVRRPLAVVFLDQSRDAAGWRPPIVPAGEDGRHRGLDGVAVGVVDDQDRRLRHLDGAVSWEESRVGNECIRTGRVRWSH